MDSQRIPLSPSRKTSTYYENKVRNENPDDVLRKYQEKRAARKLHKDRAADAPEPLEPSQSQEPTLRSESPTTRITTARMERDRKRREREEENAQIERANKHIQELREQAQETLTQTSTATAKAPPARPSRESAMKAKAIIRAKAEAAAAAAAAMETPANALQSTPEEATSAAVEPPVAAAAAPAAAPAAAIVAPAKKKKKVPPPRPSRKSKDVAAQAILNNARAAQAAADTARAQSIAAMEEIVQAAKESEEQQEPETESMPVEKDTNMSVSSPPSMSELSHCSSASDVSSVLSSSFSSSLSSTSLDSSLSSSHDSSFTHDSDLIDDNDAPVLTESMIVIQGLDKQEPCINIAAEVAPAVASAVADDSSEVMDTSDESAAVGQLDFVADNNSFTDSAMDTEADDASAMDESTPQRPSTANSLGSLELDASLQLAAARVYDMSPEASPAPVPTLSTPTHNGDADEEASSVTPSRYRGMSPSLRVRGSRMGQSKRENLGAALKSLEDEYNVIAAKVEGSRVQHKKAVTMYEGALKCMEAHNTVGHRTLYLDAEKVAQKHEKLSSVLKISIEKGELDMLHLKQRITTLRTGIARGGRVPSSPGGIHKASGSGSRVSSRTDEEMQALQQLALSSCPGEGTPTKACSGTLTLNAIIVPMLYDPHNVGRNSDRCYHAIVRMGTHVVETETLYNVDNEIVFTNLDEFHNVQIESDFQIELSIYSNSMVDSAPHASSSSAASVVAAVAAPAAAAFKSPRKTVRKLVSNLIGRSDTTPKKQSVRQQASMQQLASSAAAVTTPRIPCVDERPSLVGRVIVNRHTIAKGCHSLDMETASAVDGDVRGTVHIQYDLQIHAEHPARAGEMTLYQGIEPTLYHCRLQQQFLCAWLEYEKVGVETPSVTFDLTQCGNRNCIEVDTTKMRRTNTVHLHLTADPSAEPRRACFPSQREMHLWISAINRVSANHRAWGALLDPAPICSAV